MISFFTDIASEMLYPIMPIFLQSIGFSILLIGFLEGFAEALAGLSKGYFGKLSDSTGKRLPFVQIGYALSAISKPMMPLVLNPIWIFFSRTVDRLGKGIRTGARDAILSNESTVTNKARVFGFHRSMDSFGAVVGPLLALLFLYYYPKQYTYLFYVAFIPGLLAVMITFLLKEDKKTNNTLKPNISFLASFYYFKKSTIHYKKLVIGLFFFALVNSSDIFLLLKAKQLGLSDEYVIGLYIFYNLAYAILAYPIGIMADKVGIKTIFIIGLSCFCFVYFSISIVNNFYFFIFIFFVYAVYAAATEGISKAWIALIIPKDTVATAIGTFASFQSIGALMASSITGIIWYNLGSNYAFIISAISTSCLILYFTQLSKPNSLKIEE